MLLFVINMFCIDFWGFSNNPLNLVYNSAGQEHMFCVFLSFGFDRLEFFWSIYIEGEDPWLLEQRKGASKAKMAQMARTACGTAPPGPTWTSSVRNRPLILGSPS
jgi:hypothetical protein